jgi:membrane-bound serine protease (ClpP class)
MRESPTTMNTSEFLRSSRRIRFALAALLFLASLTIFACAGGPDAPPGATHVLTADGTVNPVMHRYIDRGISAAESDQAGAVVIQLDTPGGLSTSMDDIIKRIIDSKVPVIVYVWPAGGRAASAGTYIAYASHIAAMAPATSIGSATPIDASGGDIEGDLGNKVKGDAVAKIRGLAELRGRNAEWGERAVLEGISAYTDEAVADNIVDIEADDLDDLLAKIDGQKVALASGEATLATADSQIVYNNTNFIEDFLNIIADPNIAFLLLSLGSLGIFIELMNPGTIFPGTFGVISLLVGFFALSVLPFNWAGVALILFAFILFGLELFITSHGILGISGAIALVLGGLILTSDNPPEFQVSRWLVFGLAAFLASFSIFIAINLMRIRRMPAQMGVETIVGRKAVARSALAPAGFVFLDGEYWAAEAEDGEIKPGENVIVTAIKGLRLTVRKQKPPEGEQT